MKICIFVSILATAIASPNNDVADDTGNYRPNTEWSDALDWQLLKGVSIGNPKNVLISPLSIKLALHILYEGCSDSTEKQFQSVLQFPAKKAEVREKYKSILQKLQNKTDDSVLNIGTRLFLEASITPNQQFSAIVKSAYDTDIELTNFTRPAEASKSINSWAEKLTEGRIKELVNENELDKDVLMVVANAIFFKGSWHIKFPKSKTKTGGFYVSPTEVVNVPYMEHAAKYYYTDSKELDAKILRIPYTGSQFSMFFVLPNSKGGLPELLSNINLATLKRQRYLLEFKFVDVVIPKFKFDFESTYSKILKDLGLSTIFSNVASFPGIARGVGSGTKWLFVNEIKQKAGIEVDEEGSTVYAATEIELGNKFGVVNVFNATHPFLVYIEDESTGSILFAGKIQNPLQMDNTFLPNRFGDSEYTSRPISTPVTQATEAQNNNPPFQLNPSTPKPADTSITARFNYFDLELLKAFDDRQNYFISSSSIKGTLGMLLEGARGNTANEISQAIRVPADVSSYRSTLKNLLYNLNDRSDSTVIESANGVFHSSAYRIVPEYKTNVKKYYGAEIQPLNFANSVAASNHINGWVKNVTHNLIPELVNPEILQGDTTMVITNAIYFKGFWKNEFEEKSTTRQCFYAKGGNCIYVKMMQTMDNFKYKYVNNIDAQALQLLYGDGKYAMLVLLPGEKHSVDGLIRDLQFNSFDSVVRQLELTEVFVQLPKFEIDFGGDIIPILQNLHINDLFTENANLSGIIERGQVKVNNMVHKAKVNVNEKGTEAAAATGVVVIPLMGSNTSRFVANRPFLFFIYHVESQNILFEGRLNTLPSVDDDFFMKPSAQTVRKDVPVQNVPSYSTQNIKNDKYGHSEDGLYFNKQTKSGSLHSHYGHPSN